MNGMQFERLRHLTYDECAWRAAVFARDSIDRLRVFVRKPRWERSRLRNVLDPSAIDDATTLAIRQEDWDSVQTLLAAHMRRRGGQFVLDASLAPPLKDDILSRWPDAGRDAATRANHVLDGHFDLLGYRGLSFPSTSPDAERQLTGVDWHFDPVHRCRSPHKYWADIQYLDPANGDHKIIWELNRHQYWLQLGRAWWLTGDRRYATAIIDHLQTWLAENPPLLGVNWASMLEIGLRTISWLYGMQFLIAKVDGPGPDPDGPWLVDMLVAIDRQLTHAERHLSYYFSPNTHLTGEALALYVAGYALPELAASARRRDLGRRILLREIDRQILADGGHAERSAHYQRYTLDFYLLALMTAERHGDSIAITALTDAVTRLADFTRALADDRGRLPLIGDDDGGQLWPFAGRECHDVRDSLAVAALVLVRPDLAPWPLPEECFWIAPEAAMARAAMLAPERARSASAGSRTFPNTGYVVVRGDEGAHAVFDVGADGHMHGGHAHADALSLTLTITHRALLVDGGTSTYTMDPVLRQRMRGTANHNTVTMDGHPQSEPSGPFHWRTRARARLHASCHNAGFNWAEASHDGYAPRTHRRSLFQSPQAGWLVVDEILGSHADAFDIKTQAGLVEQHWHFDPSWMLSADRRGRLRARHFEGVEAWLLHDGGDLSLLHGDEESGLGWCAPVYGTLVPTWTARVTRRDPGPFSMITWLVPAADGERIAPTLERVDAISDPAGTAIAMRASMGTTTSVLLLRPGESALRDGRASGVREYQTNARVLHFRAHADRLLTLDLIDVTHALALCEGWLSIESSEPMRDLHVATSEATLHLSSSQPPRQLRIQRDAVAHCDDVSLNGRPYAPRSFEGSDSLVIPGDAWGTTVSLSSTGARFASDVAREIS